METQEAIKLVKDVFQRELAESLNLIRVSAPLFVRPESGLNDNLSGGARPVDFDIPSLDGMTGEIVQSLAKWKRDALARYKIPAGKGIYTDMNAIRRDEEPDRTHSFYVDQWDWEKVITKEDRTLSTLISAGEYIIQALRKTEAKLCEAYPVFGRKVPKEMFYITSQELEDMYPELTPKEREDAICQKHAAVLLMQIGDKLASGNPHDGRAPDYDDWSLNADILLWDYTCGRSMELSSMGIRVDGESMISQLKKSGCEDRMNLPFHRGVIDGTLPLTMGGGIGQSRLCMYLLEKAHIGEVQASVWPDEVWEYCKKIGIELL